jgi:hypothetical protein
VELSLLEVLVFARLHDSASWARRVRLRWEVRRRLSKLQGWAQSCPANFEAHHLIAVAEHLRMREAHGAAQEAFERAVAAARTHRSLKREALALELSARHARSQGDDARAATLRDEAIRAYRAWGALVKADALES